MANNDDPNTEPPEQELVITRVFDAPRELVFKAWTEPEHFVRWWGPKGYTTPFCTIDLRPGGVMHHCMRSPEGREVWTKGVFREIVVPERIVLTDSFADAEGNVVSPTHYGMSPDWPLETLLTVTFDEHAGKKTKVTPRHAGIPSGADRDGAQQGWIETVDRLAKYLAEALAPADGEAWWRARGSSPSPTGAKGVRQDEQRRYKRLRRGQRPEEVLRATRDRQAAGPPPWRVRHHRELLRRAAAGARGDSQASSSATSIGPACRTHSRALSRRSRNESPR